MYLYGAGGHAKVVMEIIRKSGGVVEGIYDNDPCKTVFCEIPVYKPSDGVRGPLLLSIGDNKTRYRLSREHDVGYFKAFDPSAVISATALFGKGTVIMQGAVLQAGVNVGDHSIINTNASVDHDCEIGDYAHISPGCVLCGGASVGEGTWIGAGSVVLPGVRIGRWSVIGAGSVVSKDVPDKVLAYGNRCKIIKELDGK